MEDVIEQMNAFVNTQSSYEGAEFPIKSTEDKVSLDTSKFMTVIQNTLGIEELERDDLSIEDEDNEEGFVLTEEDQKEMVDLMEQMDLELLAQPNIANDFERSDPDGNGEPGPIDVDINLAKNR